MTQSITDLRVKLFADGADLATMVSMAELNYIKGLTTNPTLMRKAGITDYKIFSLEVLRKVKNKPISFEVFTDNFDEMIRQALEIDSWAENVYVKIPVTSSTGESTAQVIEFLAKNQVKLNVTALLTVDQVKSVLEVLDPEVPSYISVFAGRIADTGIDPIEIMKDSLELIKFNHSAELIWASPRELLNVFQANEIGCHIITATSDILNKINLIGKDLTAYSLETVKMFHDDAFASGFNI